MRELHAGPQRHLPEVRHLRFHDGVLVKPTSFGRDCSVRQKVITFASQRPAAERHNLPNLFGRQLARCGYRALNCISPRVSLAVLTGKTTERLI